jgi:hypothetical protein
MGYITVLLIIKTYLSFFLCVIVVLKIVSTYRVICLDWRRTSNKEKGVSSLGQYWSRPVGSVQYVSGGCPVAVQWVWGVSGECPVAVR